MDVEVEEVTEERQMLTSTNSPTLVDLMDMDANACINKLLQQTRSLRGNRVFHLRWSGSRVPKGAVVGPVVVKWTQNGCVHDESGAVVGTYERIRDGEQQEMLVYLESAEVVRK